MKTQRPNIIRPLKPGAQVEFYWPKKSLYQGKLYVINNRFIVPAQSAG